MNGYVSSLLGIIKAIFKTRYGPRPDVTINRLINLDKEILEKNKIKKVILDLDQTCVVQNTSIFPTDELAAVNMLKTILGKDNICFLSNHKDKKRAEEVVAKTGIEVISSPYKKPHKEAYMAALRYLKTNPNKSVAMVGDRLWTDIFGANELGLFTIYVDIPLSPQMDEKGALFSRILENFISKKGYLKVIQFFLAILTITGLGLLEFISLTSELFKNFGDWKQLTKVTILLHFPFIIISNIFYWWITISNNVNSKEAQTNWITKYFNTYPLFIRYLLANSLLILYLVSEQLVLFPDYHVFSKIIPLIFFYSFFVHFALITSLFPIYHSNFGRRSRILFDILILTLIGHNAPKEWLYFIMLLFFIPVGTAAKYFGKKTISITLFLCSLSTIILFWHLHIHAVVFIILYLLIVLLLLIENSETTFPLDFLINDNQSKLKQYNMYDWLEEFRQVLSCEAVFYIKNDTEGYFQAYTDTLLQHGEISEKNCSEIFNYLKLKEIQLINNTRITNTMILKKQKELLKDHSLQSNLLLKSIIRSIICCKVYSREPGYLIAVNNFTRNGVTKSFFKPRFARILLLCRNNLELALSTNIVLK